MLSGFGARTLPTCALLCAGVLDGKRAGLAFFSVFRAFELPVLQNGRVPAKVLLLLACGFVAIFMWRESLPFVSKPCTNLPDALALICAW